MKYGSMKKGNLKTLRVPVFDDGVTFTELKNSIKDTALNDCSNIWLKDGRIKTRPGFSANGNYIFNSQEKAYETDYNYQFMGSKVKLNDQTYEVAISGVCIDDATFIYDIYFVGENGEIIPRGQINISRISSNVFYNIKNIIVYQGKRNSGSGIYMFIAHQNIYDASDVYYSLRELDSNLENWQRLDDFYVPTVCINGRGNKYAIAKSENMLSFPNPVKLESLNILTGKFNAYYTSDGFSNSFRLPFTDLSEKSIKCRVYYTLVDYVEWVIKESIISDKKQFFGKEVTITVDREKGTFYFTADGQDYAIPLMDMYNENNIKITAVKEIKNQNEKLCNLKCMAVSEGRTFLSFGENSNEIISIYNENPLYFPMESTIKVGDASKEIIAIAVNGEKLLTFFKNETHLVTLKKGEAINSTALLMDTDKTFYTNDSFSSTCISNEIGCKNPKTLCLYKDAVIWFSNTNEIFAIKSFNTKKIYKISQNVDLLISKFKEHEILQSFAVCGLGYYILKIGTKAIVLKLEEDKNQKWFVWDLPQKISFCDACNINGKPLFICKGSDRKIYYITTISSDTDTDIFYSGEEKVISNMPIGCSLTTKEFNFQSLQNKKSIEAIYFTIAAKKRVEIAVNGKTFANIDFGFSDEDYNKGVYKSVKLLHNFYGVENICVTISSNGNLSVGEMEISYTV